MSKKHHKQPEGPTNVGNNNNSNNQSRNNSNVAQTGTASAPTSTNTATADEAAKLGMSEVFSKINGDESEAENDGSQPSPEHRDLGGNVVAEQAMLTPTVAPPVYESEAIEAETEVEEAEEVNPELDKLYAFTDYWHPNVERTPSTRWAAFCLGFPGMLAYLGGNANFDLVPHEYRPLFEAQYAEALAGKPPEADEQDED